MHQLLNFPPVGQAVTSANNSTEVISNNNVVSNESTTVINHQPINNMSENQSTESSKDSSTKIEVTQALQLLASPEFAQWKDVIICKEKDQDLNLPIDDSKTVFLLKIKACKLFFPFLSEYKKNGFTLSQEEIVAIVIEKCKQDANVDNITSLNKAVVIEAWKDKCGLSFKKRPKAKTVIEFDEED